MESGCIREEYGDPHMVGHRSSPTQGLYNKCKKYPDLKFHCGTSVDEVRDLSSKPSFTISSRGAEMERVDCDVFLACGGIKSRMREMMLRDWGVDAEVVDSEQAAYRILLTREQMEDDLDFLELIDTSGIGDHRHIIAYPISCKRIYNISTTQPDINPAISPSKTYTTKESETPCSKA
ncbi:uncharacterized protein EAE97_005083 [Botrytis byssoidea]|uniref:Uncharacterized protein n=1 Tax=Botrytis byssoidea TaxID=139641 RepID=A0A9P5ILT1_9HELO|nr:uncharacterized protein EAE97_005083 [Botrytis byssoidea]KAF7946045.1 hypothetical protein EAE97_005083 [Botrytis byssoidea]